MLSHLFPRVYSKLVGTFLYLASILSVRCFVTPILACGCIESRIFRLVAYLCLLPRHCRRDYLTHQGSMITEESMRRHVNKCTQKMFETRINLADLSSNSAAIRAGATKEDDYRRNQRPRPLTDSERSRRKDRFAARAQGMKIIMTTPATTAQITAMGDLFSKHGGNATVGAS